MQLWLVAMAAIALWRADRVGDGLDGPATESGRQTLANVYLLVGYGLIAVSVIITIRAGGTVG
jgi:hypothetical protein